MFRDCLPGRGVWPTERRPCRANNTSEFSAPSVAFYNRIKETNPTRKGRSHDATYLRSRSKRQRAPAFFVIEGCSVGESLRNSRKGKRRRESVRIQSDYICILLRCYRRNTAVASIGRGRRGSERCDERSTRRTGASFLRRRTRTLEYKRTRKKERRPADRVRRMRWRHFLRN